MTYKFPLGGGGGGVDTFTALTDAPQSITPNAVVVGNDAGNGLLMSDIISINENGVFQIVENTDAGVAITTSGGGGFSVAANGSGGISLASNDGGVHLLASSDAAVEIIGSGGGGVQIAAQGTGGGYVQADGAGGLFVSGNGAGGLTLRADPAAGGLILSGLDVTASSVTVTVTVDAVSYNVAKALKVNVGGSVYFMPLFGPLA
jgi:hypothetical protein